MVSHRAMPVVPVKSHPLHQRPEDARAPAAKAALLSLLEHATGSDTASVNLVEVNI